MMAKAKKVVPKKAPTKSKKKTTKTTPNKGTAKQRKCKHTDVLHVGLAVDSQTDVLERMYRCTKCNYYIYEEITGY